MRLPNVNASGGKPRDTMWSKISNARASSAARPAHMSKELYTGAPMMMPEDSACSTRFIALSRRTYWSFRSCATDSSRCIASAHAETRAPYTWASSEISAARISAKYRNARSADPVAAHMWIIAVYILVSAETPFFSASSTTLMPQPVSRLDAQTCSAMVYTRTSCSSFGSVSRKERAACACLASAAASMKTLWLILSTRSMGPCWTVWPMSCRASSNMCSLASWPTLQHGSSWLWAASSLWRSFRCSISDLRFASQM
mmetsp:Transcript_6316/g.19520  ORF Transcript_6316/g.19520 Transcript_6316/m.19520 type:complete len:258 (+) Transcript_6316:2383-3156(+)